MLSPIDRPSLRPGTGYLIAPRVPHGLATVVESLTREVLRHRPEDIYVFAARHFEKLLKLREEYHAEEYSDREFNHEFSRDFNLWPTKETRNSGRPSNDGWSLEREIEIFERREQMPADAGESQEDVSTDRENRKASKQSTSSRGPAITKKTSKKSKDNGTTSDARATRIISQMTALHGPGKNIQTKDIKQELRKNKLSGEKSKTTESVEKGIRGDRRSRTRVLKKDKDTEEEVEHATTTTTTSSSRTSARRPLKKVRRIETESETETEREVAAKAGLENGHAKLIKNDGASYESTARNESRERRSEAWFSEHSSERKVSSRALSMDRIRAYVLRKFASTASLEVLRSPTYVEQVQEVIDRAAPIIKEKLAEIGRPRGKRSRSVDLGWNGESLHRHDQEERRRGDEKESGRGKSGNELEQKVTKKEETEGSSERDETILNAGKEEKKLRRRSVGSGKRARRRESGDFEVVDQVDDNSKHSNKSEHEIGATRDTLEARLTATQSILEGISKSTSELGGARKSELPAESDPSESEVSDHVVSLPVVRPPSSKNSKSATKNGSDSLTLPPISPEAPKSTKKKDELSLPVLPTASNNGNYSTSKPQEQDVSKDAEEASTMHDITSDMEDIAVLPENEEAIVGTKQDHPGSDLTLDVKFINEEERTRDEDTDRVFREDAPAQLDERRESLEEFEELEELEEGKRLEEVFRDSLNVTPEVVDVPLRPDSLEPDGDEVKLEDDNANAQENTFDRLKDKLIEIEMAERSIEKALACQQIATGDTGEMTSQAEKSMTDGKINEVRESTNEAEETVSEIRKSTDTGKIPINKDDEETKKNNDDEKRKSINDIEEIKDVTEIAIKTEDLNIGERLINKAEKMESEIKGSINETENSKSKVANENKNSTTDNETEKLKNKQKILKNGEKAINQTEIMTKATGNAIKAKDERSKDKTEKSTNEKLSNGVEEELAVKVHVKNLQSINPRSHNKGSQITEVVEADSDDTTTSKKKSENTTKDFSKSTTSETIQSECLITNLPNGNGKTKARKKRESDKLPMTPLSLEVPYSYVLSEGSPCEIPDSVTTVIIPDRPFSSPVTLEDEDYQLKSTNQKKELLTRIDIVEEKSKNEKQEKNQHGYDMEVFGEYIRPEVLPVDTDLMRGVKRINSNQDIVIVHQDLDKIKEEGEEEEEKEDGERKEIEDHEEDKNDKETVKEEEMKKVATLEDIVEHEEIDETDVKTIESKDIENISSSGALEHEPLSNKDLIDTGLTNEERADYAIEFRSAPENSSEESGSSTQGTHTATSSDVKESTESNPSIESPSPVGPVVPELNLDSLQDNTVSSFKITANGTEKEDNGSLRESDATTSLIEPLTSDERLMNRVVSADHEEEIVAEKLIERGLQSEIPEADQLYHAEHAEYELLGRDPLSTEINLKDETKSQEGNICLRTLLEDTVQISPQKKGEAKELESEEEIARELIDLLDKDMQCHGKKLDPKKDSGESEKSTLDMDDTSNQLLSVSMPSISVEQEKRKDSLDKIDDVIRTEATSELSSNVEDINQANKDKENAIINEETEKIKLDVEEETHIKNSQIAPLAQFEQDELLEENHKIETVDERITVESKPDIINADHIDTQEKQIEEKQTSIEEIPKSQSSDNKIEESNSKQEENDQNQEKREQQKLEAPEEGEQGKLHVQEEIELEKLKVQDESDQENVKMEKKIEQEKLKVQDESDQENVKMEEKIEQGKLKVQDESDQENVKMEKKNEQEKLKVQDESDQENVKMEEKIEQEKLKVQDESDQKNVKMEEKIEQKKLNIQGKSEQENVKIEEEIIKVTAMPLHTESKKDSMNESIKNDNEHEENKSNNESITDDQTGKNVENEEKKKMENLSKKVESVHGPITSAISEQSVEDRSRFGLWTTETKSSTVETVIEAFDSNASTDEKMEIVADASEIIADESLIQKKDFHSAVVKIQACIRGFLTRRRVRRNLKSEDVSNHVPLTQKIVTNNHLVVPQDTLSLREARRLRREEALRNTTLSLENAFATGRLQHTGEFHDSVPLHPFDVVNSKTSSVTSNDSLDEETGIEEANPPDITKTSASESDPVRDSEHGTSFQKAFIDPTFPIMMHLLTSASGNCHFSVSQNSHSDFNANAEGAKPMEPTVDILMLGYPRNDENQYLNFITSVEDLGSDVNSLTLDGTMKNAKSTDDAHPSTTSGEGSLREPLALPGDSQGVLIEEVTSLDELVPSESTKPSTAPKTSLDTNSSMPSEEYVLEDTKNDLERSPRTANTTEDRKQGVEGQKSDGNSENVEESNLRSKDVNKENNKIFHEHMEDRKQGVEGQESDGNSENVEESNLRSKDVNKENNKISHEHMEEKKDDEK